MWRAARLVYMNRSIDSGSVTTTPRREFLKFAGWGAVALTLPAVGKAAASVLQASGNSRPNIVFILADDYGWGSAGCYGADEKLVRTPNIDRLAREGRRFTDACTASSVCSPTRYAVMTGRYCWRTPLKFEVLGVFDPLWIEPSRLTVASLLKQCGYCTAAIGKWHLGYGPAKPVDYTQPLRPGPLNVGFDFHLGIPSNHGDVTGIYVDCEHVQGLRSSKLTPSGACYYGGKPFLGLDAPQRKDVDVMDVLTNRAVEWIGAQTPDKPFFLYFTPVAVHEPVTPSDQCKGSSKAGPYGDWIHELDRSVGKILAVLDQQKFTENTLVIFTSDNGGENKKTRSGEQVAAIAAGLQMNGAWREGKHSIFEGGFRVPYVARWPGRVPAGTVCDETIGLVDTLATVAAIVGAPLPVVAQGAEDSYNILPALLGEQTVEPLRPALIEHSADGVFAVRSGPWKWIEGKCAKLKPPKSRATEFRAQLYNLRDDPAERHDVLEQNPGVVQRLAALLQQYRVQGFSRPT